MKIKDFYATHDIDQKMFIEWVNNVQNDFRIKVKDWSTDVTFVDDSDVDKAIENFTNWEKQELDAIEAANADALRLANEAEAEAERKKKALASMLITSGFSFDGFSITKYSGYISGDDVIQIERGRQGFFATATDVGASLMENLVVIRRNAINELKEAAYALGCNAVIGVDFDYLTLDPETVNANGGTLYLPYVFGVTANGNAVVIERDK
jgi:uncharacterized protein YbjQ (UPF0145 family)